MVGVPIWLFEVLLCFVFCSDVICVCSGVIVWVFDVLCSLSDVVVLLSGVIAWFSAVVCSFPDGLLCVVWWDSLAFCCVLFSL